MAFLAIIFIAIFIGMVMYLLGKVEKIDSKEADEISKREKKHTENLNYLRKHLNSEDIDSYYMLVEAVVKLHKKVEELERTYKRDH
jgi:hypothetical protein